MYRAGGYTLIEVMLFLAISAVLFASTVLLISGKQGRNQFYQSMRDIDSKINQYIDQVSASYFPSQQNYICTTPSPTYRPTLNSGASDLGTNQDCIFLGKALQFTRNSGNADDTLTTYSVLGRRVYQQGTTEVQPSSLDQADPTPFKELQESYTLPFGVKIKSACRNGTPTCSAANNRPLASFYIDLSQVGADPNGNRGASLVSYFYPTNVNLSTTPMPANGSGIVYSCLTLSKTNCTGLTAIVPPTIGLPTTFTASDKWVLCFASASSSQTATVTVTAGPEGVQTKTDFVTC